ADPLSIVALPCALFWPCFLRLSSSSPSSPPSSQFPALPSASVSWQIPLHFLQTLPSRLSSCSLPACLPALPAPPRCSRLISLPTPLLSNQKPRVSARSLWRSSIKPRSKLILHRSLLSPFMLAPVRPWQWPSKGSPWASTCCPSSFLRRSK